MESAKASPEEMLQERLGVKCDEEIARKIREFGGLLSRNAAIVLLCKQNGIDLEKQIFLSEAKKTMLPFSFHAKVDRIFPTQVYSGANNRSVRLHLSDSSGKATLLLWNEQANIVMGEVSVGDVVECKGAYFKNGEIGLGRNGSIKKEKAFPLTELSQLTYGVCNVQGEVKSIDSESVIDNRDAKQKTFSFLLCDKDVCKKAIIWSQSSDAQKLQIGDVLLLENIFFRNNELHLDEFSRVVKKRSVSDLFGVFLNVDVEGEQAQASFQIDENKYSVEVPVALSLLHINSIPPGVSPQVLIKIKSSEFEGKRVKYLLEGVKLVLFELA